MDGKTTTNNSVYFQSYDDLEVHRLMLKDASRTDTYRSALMNNADKLKDKIVMDVGAGTGILSLFCKAAGAKKIYAIEASPMAYKLEEIVKLNNAEDVIQVVHKRVEDVVLDVKVDIIVSEWMGFYLVHESMLDSVLVARDKHLKQESGFMLPSHASIWAAPCSLEDLKHTTIDYWRSVYGFDMSPLAQESIKRSKPEIMIISPDQLLAQPVCVANFDLNNVTIEDLSSIDKRHFVSATRPGSFHGLAIWFETPFSPNVEGWAHPQVLSTSPSSNPTHWKQTIIPLFSHTSEDIEEDEVIGWDLSLKKVHNDKSSEQRQYAIQVERLDPASEDHPVPCGCQAAKCVLIEALMAQDDIDNAGIDDISLKNKF